ncbi:MAG: hypothetical protein ABIO39_12030 [Caulobacteraceae bacterium]
MRVIILAALLSLAALSAQAEPNTPKRVAAFGKLPDWTGEWAPYPLSPNPGGQGGFKGILFLGHPPYNAKWEAAYQGRLKAYGDVLHKSCMMDFPVVMDSPQPFEIIVTPEQTLIAVGDGAQRHIYTDGRKHPDPDDLWPTPAGDSIGHWEGKTLVVDTIARRVGPDTFTGRLDFSEAAHFVERIRETAPGELENQMTIEDPVAFTAPWRLTLVYRRLTDLNRIIPYDCEKDRIEVVDGKGRITPP